MARGIPGFVPIWLLPHLYPLPSACYSPDPLRKHDCPSPAEERRRQPLSGCSSAWLERLVWDQEVAGPNPVTPTILKRKPFGERVEGLSYFWIVVYGKPIPVQPGPQPHSEPWRPWLDRLRINKLRGSNPETLFGRIARSESSKAPPTASRKHQEASQVIRIVRDFWLAPPPAVSSRRA